MDLKLETAPAEEPLTIAEAKQHLRVLHEDEDAYITDLIPVARQTCEDLQRRSYVDTVWKLWADAWPRGSEIVLPRGPLSAVASVKYYDTADTEYTLSTDDYIVDDGGEFGRVVLRDGASWPTTSLRTAKAIVVEFTAGHGDEAAAVPARFKHVVRLALAHLYEQREPVVTGTIATEIPMTLAALIDKDRLGGFVG